MSRHYNDQRYDILSDSAAIGVASTPDASRTQTPATGSLSSSHLTTPSSSHPPRRPSLDSLRSERSGLSRYSDELRHQQSFLRDDNHKIRDGDGANLTGLAPSSIGARWRIFLSNFYTANYGSMLVLLAMFFGNLMNIFARLLEIPGNHGAPMHPFQILFVRQTITASCCTIYAVALPRLTKAPKVTDFPLGPRGLRWLLVIRGLAGFFGVFGLYFSLLYLPLSEAVVLTFLSPILTCYVCSLLLPGETFSRQQQLAGLLSLVGVIFIAQPADLFASSDTDPGTPASTSGPRKFSQLLSRDSQHPTPHQHLIAVAVAMLGVLGSTGAMTAIRAIGTRVHPFISINYFSVWSSIVSLACLATFPEVKFRLPGNILEWSLLALLGGCGFVMQFLLTSGLAYGGNDGVTTKHDRQRGDEEIGNAFQLTQISSRTRINPVAPAYEPPHIDGDASQAILDKTSDLKKGSQTRATSMMYTQMLFALAGDKMVFGVIPDTMSWIGSGLILTGAVWVATAKEKGKGEAPKKINHSTDVMDSAVDNLPVEAGDTVMPNLKARDVSESGTKEEGIGLLAETNEDGMMA